MINLIECQKSANIEIRLILLISPLHKRVKNNSVTNQLFTRESVKIRPTLTAWNLKTLKPYSITLNVIILTILMHKMSVKL